MKNFFIAIATIFSVSITAQSLSPREKQLFDIASKSYELKNNDKSYKTYVVKKYACLEKYYDLNPLEQKEFLSEKDFRAAYPTLYPSPTEPIEYSFEENQSFFELMNKPQNFKKINGKYIHLYYPKCIIEKDYNFKGDPNHKFY